MEPEHCEQLSRQSGTEKEERLLLSVRALESLVIDQNKSYRGLRPAIWLYGVNTHIHILSHIPIMTIQSMVDHKYRGRHIRLHLLNLGMAPLCLYPGT